MGLASILCFNQVAARKEVLHQTALQTENLPPEWQLGVWRRIFVWSCLTGLYVPRNGVKHVVGRHKNVRQTSPRQLGYKKEALDFFLLQRQGTNPVPKAKDIGTESIPKAFVLSWDQDCTLKPMLHICMILHGHPSACWVFSAKDAKAVEQANHMLCNSLCE